MPTKTRKVVGTAILVPMADGPHKAIWLEEKTGAGKGAAYYAIRDRIRFSQTYTVRNLDRAPAQLVVARVFDDNKAELLGTLVAEETTYVPGGKDSGNEPARCVQYSGSVSIGDVDYRPQLRANLAPQGGITFWSNRGVTLASWKGATPGKGGVVTTDSMPGITLL